jgi:alpha,alpha-trehalase
VNDALGFMMTTIPEATMKSDKSLSFLHLKRFTRSMLVVLSMCTTIAASAQSAPAAANAKGLKPILDYISTAWDTLTRSMTDCKSIVDPKITAQSVLYLPKELPEPASVQTLVGQCNVRVEHLPTQIQRLGEISTSNIDPPGLLYLPNKYVVPGGRFNEMYGWDSYFIIRGLLRGGRIELARGMVDNFLFEIEHYGDMLNANRTYYLTRSQPPFVSSMFVDVYEATRKQPGAKDEKAWLERAYADLSKDYEVWTHEPHLAGDTGLSRYYDFGDGPPPEAVKDETGFYRKVALYFFLHPQQADSYLVETQSGTEQSAAGAAYTLQVCDTTTTMAHPDCESPRQFKLSKDYYKGDRSMRESGFDVSFRFGAFGSATHHYAPVCLNSLLYKTEKDLEQISRWLGRADDAEKWSKRAEDRKSLITKYLWNGDKELFFDFDFVNKKMSGYNYATAFYPLWAGLATPEQAKGVPNDLKLLDHPGGVAMSTEESGAQWDLPYGWGNIEMLVVEGLRRYGFNADADRVSYEFLSTVAENFRREGEIHEKYDVVNRSSEAHAELGYHMNVVGFGWTNAAFLELLHNLPKEMTERLEKEQRAPMPAN